MQLKWDFAYLTWGWGLNFSALLHSWILRREKPQLKTSTAPKLIQSLDFHSIKEFGGPSQHQHNEKISVLPHHYLRAF